MSWSRFGSWAGAAAANRRRVRQTRRRRAILRSSREWGASLATLRRSVEGRGFTLLRSVANRSLGRLLRQLHHRLVEELDALGQVLVEVLEVAELELDRQVALIALLLQFGQHADHVALAGAPGDVVAAAEL